jgi:hypothetical protein
LAQAHAAAQSSALLQRLCMTQLGQSRQHLQRQVFPAWLRY